MHNFVMYCKTYSGDFERLSNLLKSIKKYNKDNIPLYISAPEHELYLFRPFSSANIFVISDESFAEKYLAKTGHSKMSVGYINQQICKLTFHKTELTKNYLCLDSDTIFIRNFYISDFMYDDNTPFTVLVMDKDLSIERHYRKKFWVGRQKAIKKIYDFMKFEDQRLRACHNSQVFNVQVLKSLEKDFMKPKMLQYNDLLKISPYEFTWYNVWFQKSELIKEITVEPFFKMLHMRQEYTFSRLRLLRQEDFALAYVGLILNSKWIPKTPLNYENPDNFFYKLFYKIVTRNFFLIKVYLKLARKDIFQIIYKKYIDPKFSVIQFFRNIGSS